MSFELTARCDGGDRAALDVIFSGHGCMPTTDAFICGELDAAFARTIQIAAMRQDAAISGAMRYPWSQEFALCASVTIQAR